MLEDMKVREGYKKTEIGVIPEDWNTVVIDEICDIRRGASPRPIESFVTDKNNGVNWIKIGDVNKSGKINKTAQKIIQEGAAKSVQVKIGDLLLSNSMSFGKPYILEIDGCIHDGWLAISEKEDVINKKYLFYYLTSQNAKDFFDKMSAGSGVKNLNKAIVSNLVISLPNKEEQKVVAKALTDTDNLIHSIEKIIEKKEKIKQGTMQELLTGKKRLDGFSGEWEKSKIGDLCTVLRGKIITEANSVDGDIPVIAGGMKPSYYHSIPNRTGKTITISGSGANAGYIGFHDIPIYASDCLTISEQDDKYNIEFIYYRLILIQDKIYYMQTGGAQPHIYPKDIEPIEIRLPFLEEQKAIAQILSDMDLEIQKLKEKLEKYKTIKKGMMQELLTGRIRLI